MKTYYSDFVGHCARHFARCQYTGTAPHFASAVERDNYQACEYALKTFAPEDSSIILDVYANTLPGSVIVPSISQTVNRIARKNNTTPEDVWKLISTFERRVAKRRGLI